MLRTSCKNIMLIYPLFTRIYLGRNLFLLLLPFYLYFFLHPLNIFNENLKLFCSNSIFVFKVFLNKSRPAIMHISLIRHIWVINVGELKAKTLFTFKVPVIRVQMILRSLIRVYVSIRNLQVWTY